MDLFSELQQALGDAYVIQRELSGGAMGRVFVAREVSLGRDVVVKVRTDDGSSLTADRFLREIAVAARLRHPNIVPVLSSGRAAGLLYYTMPFINGRSLRDVLQADGRLPVDLAIQYALEVTDALSYAHSQGIIHRDIKPENILIDSGHAVVTDFGLARAIDGKDSAALTQHGVAVGTPLYMSPEQISGDHAVDGRTDIFSLACVLYEMLTGAPPFTGESMMIILASRFREPSIKLRVARSDVPARLATAVEKALAADPGNRYHSAERFAAALKGVGVRPEWAVPAGIAGIAALLLVGFFATRDRAPGVVAQAASPPQGRPTGLKLNPSPTTTAAAPTAGSRAPAIINGSTEDILRYSINKYSALELGDAMDNLRNMLSANFLQPVTTEQRVRAFLYMGAIYADIGKADSARNFFMGALAYDPFSQPDSTWASASARRAYLAARNSLFIIEAAGFREHVLKQGDESRPYDFRIGMTQPARLIVRIISERDSTVSETLFDGRSEGTRQARWVGTVDGRTAGAGLYELRIQAAPTSGQSAVTKSYPFRIDERKDARSGATQIVMTPGR